MIDMAGEIQKAISQKLKKLETTVKYYSTIKEQGFETPCIMIAPIGDSGSKINYEFHDYQHHNLGFQILYFPGETTVMKGEFISQREACLTIAEEIINMRYIGDVALIQRPSYTISNGTLSLIFYTRLRGRVVEDVEPFMKELEENGGISHG